jgi:hypothetical protein
MLTMKNGIVLLPEDQMPLGTRADIGVRYKDLLVPIEAKGQWHRDLWTAPQNQLDLNYSSDFRASRRGVYLVFWFGDQKVIQPSPDTDLLPSTPIQLKEMLEARIAPGRRDDLRVFVLDLARRPRRRRGATK